MQTESASAESSAEHRVFANAVTKPEQLLANFMIPSSCRCTYRTGVTLQVHTFDQTSDPMADKATIYHNPRCSKSRAALEYLESLDIAVATIEYLKSPPDKQTLTEILRELQLKPRELMRQGDAKFKELNLADDSLTVDQLIDALVEHPVLLERPVVRFNGDAAIGRPLDNIIDLLDA